MLHERRRHEVAQRNILRLRSLLSLLLEVLELTFDLVDACDFDFMALPVDEVPERRTFRGRPTVIGAEAARYNSCRSAALS